MARFPARQGGFRTDPHAPLVFALEEFDSATQRATKAAILTQRVVAPRTPKFTDNRD
jgi:N12 class adenine-specific DNA methylase